MMMLLMSLTLFDGTLLAAPGDGTLMRSGILVSVDQKELVITDRQNQQHVLTVADQARVTIDGRVARAGDLRVGMGLTALSDRNTPRMAFRVEARSRE